MPAFKMEKKVTQVVAQMLPETGVQVGRWDTC